MEQVLCQKEKWKVGKNFWSEKLFGKKNIWSRKKYFLKKKFGQKNILKKILVENFHLIEKKYAICLV